MPVIDFIVAVLTVKACTAVAENLTGASITPQGAVRRVGDKVEFECRSPDGYTTLQYRKIVFEWEHGEQKTAVDVEDVVNVEEYTKIKFDFVASKQHSGTNKCHIYPSGGDKNVNVTVTTELYVVEAEDKTTFVEKDKPYKLDCLESDNLGFKPVISWYVEGKVLGIDSSHGQYSVDGTFLHIKSAGEKEAFTDIRCAVTSQEAFRAFGSVTDALRNQSAAEINKTLSVIDVSQYKKPRQIEVKVFGHTPVDISWMINSHVVNSTHEVTENFTVSKTEVLNSTEPVQLTITGGQNNWTESITPDPTDDTSNGQRNTGIVVIIASIASIAAIVVIAMIIFLGIKWVCKGTQHQYDADEGNTTQEPLYQKKSESKENDQEMKKISENGEETVEMTPRKDDDQENGEETVEMTPRKDDDQGSGEEAVELITKCK